MKKNEKKWDKRFQKQVLIFHCFVVGPSLLKRTYFFWMEEIWSGLNVARGRERWDLKEMMDGARFQRRLDQTVEEMTVTLSVSWQLEVPSQSPHFGFWRDLAQDSSCPFRVLSWVSVPRFHQLLQLRMYPGWSGEERKLRECGERDPIPACNWELTHTQHLPHVRLFVLGFCTFLWSPLNFSLWIRWGWEI